MWGIQMAEQETKYTKQSLRKQMDEGLTSFLAELDHLSEEQMLGPKDAVGWNVRDHLTHLVAWMDGITALLRREDRWAAMGLPGEPDRPLDFDKINAQIAEQNRQLSPADVRARLVESHRRIVEAMEALDEGDLYAPYDRFVPPFTGTEGRAIVNYILGDSADHYEEHLPWIRGIIENQGH